jgi:hypothetical protein
MILPASKVRPRSENFCSAIGDTFTAAPLPQNGYERSTSARTATHFSIKDRLRLSARALV